MDTLQRPFFWSFSALDGFETCPKKFYHTRIAKDFVEPESEHQRWGKQVHAALDKAVNHGSPLPPEMSKWQPWVEFAKKPFDPATAIMKSEQQLAITEDMQPCEYLDKRVPVWFRTVIDVLKVSGEFARIIDWKTGNSDCYLDPETNTWKTNSDQLNLAAAVVMAHYPEVQHVKTDFVWLKEDFWTVDLISRSDLPRLWQRLLPRVDKMKLAHGSGVYPPTPSGLCKRHCPVKSCQYHGKGGF
jgi:hypothetical protein